MNHRARRYFDGTITTLLLVCAYAQARGVNALIVAHLLPTPAAVAAIPMASIAAKSAAPPPPPAAAPIIARNPFDSFTGPLNSKELIVPPPDPIITDPLRAPKCDGLRVESTAVANDPTWSTAVVQASNDERGRLRRVGDPVGTMTVAYIGYNRVQQGPTVWFADGSGLCQAHVFDAEVKALKPPPQRRRSTRSSPPSKQAARLQRTPRLPRNIARKIRRVNATEYVIARSAVDTILDQQAKLMRHVRVRPHQKNGKVASLSVNRVRRGTLLSELGIRNGDRIRSINGYSLTSPEKALQAYSRLRTSSELSLELMRGGRPLTIEYRIQ